MGIKLSITIVAYRNYEDIKATLKTIEQYTPRDIEKQIYIVDNSNPKTDIDWKSVTDFQLFLSEYSDVQYIDTKANLGFGKGHNYIINCIDSQYHAIVNPDILLTDDAFSSIIKFMDRNEAIGMCIPRIINEQGDIQLVYRRELTIFDVFIRMFCKKFFPKRIASHTLQDMDYSKPFQVPFGQGSFLVIRTQLFKELDGFDDRFFMYLEDADLCKRVNQKSKLMYYPGATVIHKWEQGSHRSINLFKIHVHSMIKYFKKWGCKFW